MSPQFYVIVHLISILVLVSGITLSLLTDHSKWGAKLSGIGALLAFIAGFGLMAKFGYTLASGWILAKLTIWLFAAAVAPIIAKRFPHLKTKAYMLTMVLLASAVILGVIKPF
jgi:hypothetical protein